MEEIISKKKLHKYITENNYDINQETLNHVIDNLKRKNSKLFSVLNSEKIKVGGKISMPSEYYGNTTNNYSNTLSTSPTEVSTSSALENYTRPPMTSEHFPLEGGCNSCGTTMSGGGCSNCGATICGGCGKCNTNKICKLCNKKKCKHNKHNTKKGGCVMCKTFFTHKDISNISKLLNLNISKKDYNQLSNYLTRDLKTIMQLTFQNVKNKNNLIGKSHFTKALKNF